MTKRRAFNALERLGLEVAAYNLLGSRAQAAALLALIDANGRRVSWEVIAQARAYKTQTEVTTANAVKVRICLLRDSLDDVGLGGLIWSSPNHARQGQLYALPEPGRAAVLARLVQDASE